MPSVPYQLLRSFADDDAAGNPAGVVTAADDLTEAQMQAVAASIGAPETAFVLSGEPNRRLRWFSPTCEIGLCGHATLAAAAASGRGGEFDYAGGRLRVIADTVGGETLWWLRREAPGVGPEPGDLGGVLRALGSPTLEELPPQRTEDGDLLVILRSAAEVEALAPAMTDLAAACEALDLRGVAVLGPGEGIHELRTRFFAPRVGIPEDPATGSAHGAVAVWLYNNEILACDPDELRALSLQGSAAGPRGVLWLRLHAVDGVPRTVDVGGRVRRAGGGDVDC